jgi:lipopolysaccharide transport system ATP-binding protein
MGNNPSSCLRNIDTEGGAENEVVVSVKNVSKKFCKTLRRSMGYGIVDLTKNLVGSKPNSTRLRKDEFWALDNISFELRKGEVLGVVGLNGSGKTTLLRLLSGIFPPDKGEIMIKGRVGALIALGAGFHPHMTGRENVYLNGAILGLKREELDAEFERIVNFAEIGSFIDAPVATYSSGMRVKLGFSVAMAIKPDVLLIDEVLAVGDVAFKTKCFNAITGLTKRCAVLFVSHNMATIAKISTEILLLNEGHKEYHGRDISEGIYTYFNLFPIDQGVRIGEDKVLLKSCGVRGEEDGKEEIKYLENVLIDIEFIFLKKCWSDVLMLVFMDKEATNVAVTYLKIPEKLFRINTPHKLTVKILRNPFSAGNYSVTVIFAENFNETVNGRVISQYNSAVSFKIIDSATVTNIPIQLQSALITGEY